MAELVTIARPYAEAAFSLASEQNALANWAEMLQAATLMAKEAKLLEAIENPMLTLQEKFNVLNAVGVDRFDETGRSFIRLLLQERRFNLLPEIAALFQALKDEAEGTIEAKVISAFPVAMEQLAELTAMLQKRYGKQFRTMVTVDPALIGGIRIEIGDQVIDGSIQGRLDRLATQLHS